MVVHKLVTRNAVSGAEGRAQAVGVLARAWCENRVPASEAPRTLAELTLALEDASPLVRAALADALATSPRAPRRLVVALGNDAPDIARRLAGSPVLTDGDLAAMVRAGRPAVQVAIAGRRPLAASVTEALAAHGGRDAALALVDNGDAAMTPAAHRVLAERFGTEGPIRSGLLDRTDTPVDVRQTLLLQLGHALAGMGLLSHSVGAERARRLAFEACERGTSMLADRVPAAEAPLFIEHLRVSGQLSTAFLIRVVCAGNIDLFAAAVVALSGVSARRVRAIVVDGRETAFAALMATAGLPASVVALLRSAVEVWKSAAARGVAVDPADVPAIVMTRLVEDFRRGGDAAGFDAVYALLSQLEVETARDGARRLAAAA